MTAIPVADYVWVVIAYWSSLCFSGVILAYSCAAIDLRKGQSRTVPSPVFRTFWTLVLAAFAVLAFHAAVTAHQAAGYTTNTTLAIAFGFATSVVVALVVRRRIGRDISGPSSLS
jgi:hypothetical protein